MTNRIQSVNSTLGERTSKFRRRRLRKDGDLLRRYTNDFSSMSRQADRSRLVSAIGLPPLESANWWRCSGLRCVASLSYKNIGINNFPFSDTNKIP